MGSRVHPSIVSTISSKELREIQKLHELGKKYWPAADKRRYEEEVRTPEPRLSRYLFRHPYSRLAIAYLVVFCNFLIFAEDPVSHSYRECTIDVIGEIYTFIFVRWPGGYFSLIKFICWMFALLLGMWVGKSIIHRWFFCKVLKLKMFTEDGQGSWMVMFLTSLLSIFIFSFAYNGFLMLEGKYMDKFHASARMSMENQTFMKVAAIGTWLGDFFTAWMVTDMMLQSPQYAHWAKALRRFWKQALNRVYAFWFVFVVMTIVVSTAISTDYLNWDELNRDFVASNELSRAFLASFILVMDLMIVLQDWDFPHFAGSLDIKLPGVNSDSFDFKIPRCCGAKPLDVYITGKWFNYGIIFIVMILDLNMWKNQIFYSPFAYGQYTDPEGYIYTVSDRQFLRWGNETLMSYKWRWDHINPKTNKTYGLEDLRMNAKYKGYSLTLKGIAFVPSILAFCVFGYLVWLFGQEENPDELLVHKYRRDMRHQRQLKRLRRKTKKLQGAVVELSGNEENRIAWSTDFPPRNEQDSPRPHVPASPSEQRNRNSEIIDMAPVLFDGETANEGDVTEAESADKTQEVKKNFTYYLRHPYFRIVTSYLVVFCNFLIFAEDPVSHSYTDCIIDVIGNMYSFVFARYPPEAGFVALKIFMYLLAIGIGMVIGKIFVHKFLLCRVLKLRMFSEDGQGSWMIMFLCVLMFLYILSFIYNEFLLLGGEHFRPYLTSNNMGIQNQTFMKMAAIGTWLGDFITAWMVTDMMLQENQYPQWSPGLRAFWRRGRNRVYAFWLISFAMSAVVATAITTDYLNWDEISSDFAPTNEVSRAFLASFILVMDLMIVMQDWDFPYFDSSMNIKLPGLNTGNFHFHLPGGDIRITGKWFNYGIIFIVMILDLNMWKNQIFYEPFAYGQYTDDGDYIYTVVDIDFIENATESTLSYTWRWSHVNSLTNKTYGSQDHKMNSRYVGFLLSTKGTAFIPSLFAFALFGILVKYFSKGGPPLKVDKTPETSTVAKRANDNGPFPKIDDETDDVGSLSFLPHVTSNRNQSQSSFKSDVSLTQRRQPGSFSSVPSSRAGANLSCCHLDGSCDQLDNSLATLNSSRDDLRSSLESLGDALSQNLQTSLPPAWYSNVNSGSNVPETALTRKGSAAMETAPCYSRGPDNNNDHENADQVLSFSDLNKDNGEMKEKQRPNIDFLTVNNETVRSLSLGALFRREAQLGSRSLSHASMPSSDEEDGAILSVVVPSTMPNKAKKEIP